MTPDEDRIIEIVEAAIAKAIPTAVEPVIRKTVNGKIDRLTDRLENHISAHEQNWEEIRPFVQGVAGAKILGSGFKWFAGIAAGYLVIRDVLIK